MAGFQVLTADGTVIRDLDFDSGFVSSSSPSYQTQKVIVK